MIHRDLLRKNAQTIIDDEINPDKDIVDFPPEVYLAMKHLARDIHPRVVIELLDTLEQAEREAAHFKALSKAQTETAWILLKAFGNSQKKLEDSLADRALWKAAGSKVAVERSKRIAAETKLSDAGWALDMDRQGGA